MARQYAGMTCGACGRKITDQTEGTYCVSCEDVFHIDCVALCPGTCPGCRARWIDPAELYVYFKLCPICGYRTTENLENCRCGNRLYCDSEEDIRTYYKRIFGSKRSHLLYGGLSLVIGIGLMVTFVVTHFYPIMGGLVVTIGGLTTGFMMILWAIPRLFKYRIENKFCRMYSILIKIEISRFCAAK